MFTYFYITSKGKLLEARLHAQDELQFTRFQIGNGTLMPGQSQEAMTALISPIKTLPVAKAEVRDNQAVITFHFSNLGMDSFDFREIGLFANDPVDGEILYAYANAGDDAENIPAYSTSPVSFTYGMNISFSNAKSFNVIFDDDLAFATHEELARKKDLQSVISSPSASGNALAFIDTISQNEKGVISATKKNVTVDATPTANSTNPVQSGGVKAALDRKQGTLTFDNAPMAGSDNPVKSGGVKEALDGKKNTQTAISSPSANGNALAFIDTISQNEQGVIAVTKKSVTVDATPTANSTNPVQSGGVKTALDDKLPVVGKGINLLDNWYFVGGGSQQGGGQFPINQRGGTITIDEQTVNGYESTYSNCYSIDRWLLFGSETWKLARVEIKNDCIKVRLGSNRGIGIIIPFLPAGKYKLSIFFKRCSSAMIFGLANKAAFNTSFIGNSIGIQRSEVPKIFECSVTLESDVTNKIVVLKSTGDDNCYAEIIAIKLELGDTQTLAHQENGEWVLNDPPPDYNTELLKCQMSTADPSDTYTNRAVAKADSIAIIVDGDTAGTAVSAGQYAYIRNNTHGLKEGLYRNKSSSAFPVSGGTADGTVFEAVPGGGFNNLLTDYMVITYHYITTGETSESQSAPTYPWELIAAKPGYTGVMFNFTSVQKSSQTIINAETVFFRDGQTTIRGYCSRPSISVTIVILWKRNG